MTIDMGSHALDPARHGWAVFPLRGEVPWIGKKDGGNGVLDATTDQLSVASWWLRFPNANIRARVPSHLFILDVDPRNGGAESLWALEVVNGALPETLTVYSGRVDGGRHWYDDHPGGKLASKHLDVKTSSRYVVVPPSLHPVTGLPYRWTNQASVLPPSWLVDLLRPERRRPPTTSRRTRGLKWSTYGSPADEYNERTSWVDLLLPHNWECLEPDPDCDGARWRHPCATSAVSATVRHGCLLEFSPNTPFDVTEANDPHGVTKFGALALLDREGDLWAAARSLRAESR